MKYIKKIIKRFPILMKFIDSIRFKKEFYYDYKFFKRNYSHSKETKNKLGYNILLETHGLEKGMSNKNPRYFGIKKINNIMEMIKKYTQYNNYENDYAFINGVNSLRSYAKFYKDNNWTNRNEYKNVILFLEKYNNIPKMNIGSMLLKRENFIKDACIDYDKFLSSRHSTRNYKNKKISDKDIKKAISMAIKTPTACNRQMVKIYYISNQEKSDKIIKIGQGFGGFDAEVINIFVITFDVNANYFIGERNQGWFNSGLVSMNFVNALHSLGIGSCFVQFGNKTKEEELVKQILCLPSNERIAVLLAAGYYADESKITLSSRKSVKDIYKEIN